MLVVGSDSRANLPASSSQHFGSAAKVVGQRSDVIIILHMDPSSQQASILSIPRDLFVPIAGTRGSDRINSAYNKGPDQLVQTIQQYLNIPINHYVSMDFQGFQGIVDSVAGISMNFPVPARDRMSGLNITQPGCQYLNGAAALALARSRDYQYLGNGRWQSDGTGDLGRIQRQHAFIRILMQKAVSAGIHNPVTANSLIASAVNDVTVDQGLSTADMVQLALGFRSLQPSAVPSYTIPTRAVNGYQSFGDVLFAVQPQTGQVVAQFLNSGAPPPAPGPPPSPASIKVNVLNGSGVGGQAEKAGRDLS
ncbi:MAG: LCP family protein, partial [Mycobacterium sp.]